MKLQELYRGLIFNNNNNNTNNNTISQEPGYDAVLLDEYKI